MSTEPAGTGSVSGSGGIGGSDGPRGLDGGVSGGSPGPIGLVINRPGRPLGMEPFLIELVEGIEEVFSPLDRSLRFNIVTSHDQETAIWRRWAEQGSVDAIIMLDLYPDDDRLPVLDELGVPAAVLGGPRGGLPLSNVFVDSAAGATDAVDALADLGHRRIAYVCGPHALLHSQTRTAAFLAQCATRGCVGVLAEGDYYETSGRDATVELLRLGAPPTAIFYDNVVMAVAGLGVLSDLGLGVPDDVSIMVWDDTALSRLTPPGLSVVAVDVHGLGVAMAQAVLGVLAGAAVSTYDSPRPEVRLRGSTAPPPGSSRADPLPDSPEAGETKR
jgi:DNA-binding LacI/PurR family transcriptional regulator